MAYIGREPVTGNFVKLDSITVVNGQAAYTMNNGGSAFTAYDNVNQFLVSLNGVLQAPTDSFTVSGSTLTFASNLATGDVIDFVIVLGDTLDIGTPSDNTVTAAKLNDDIISGSTALASEPADTDEFLVSDAGTLKRIDYSLIKGGGITMAQQWRVTTGFTGTTNPIASNWEIVDTDGYGDIGSDMTESSGIFTFPSTGIYYISFEATVSLSGSTRWWKIQIETTTDNSSYSDAADSHGHINQVSSATYDNASCNFIFDVTSTSTHKARFSFAADNSSTGFEGNTGINSNSVTFIRLGDT